MRTHYEITEGPLDLERMISDVLNPSAGAVASFMGVARNSFEGKEVERLEYEAYKPMAERTLAEIGTEIAERWPEATAVAIAHRLGRVDISQASVIIAVSAPHRREALEACSYGIDRLKAILPVWKKEFFAGGEVWRENATGRP